jgi:hypothetical protein
MDEAKVTAVRAYYESLSDEALLAEADAGRDAFTPEAWTIVSEQIELRGLQNDRAPRQRLHRQNDAAVNGSMANQPSRVARLSARVDTLPPSIRPAVFGALLIVLFAMARGAWLVLPLALIYLFATSTHPWTSLMTGVVIAVLAMAGGALSGLAYGLVGRHLRTAVRGGYYLTGILTLAPYMFVLTLILRLSKGESLWHRLSGTELAMSGILTLIFGLVLGRAWFGPSDEGQPTEPAT